MNRGNAEILNALSSECDKLLHPVGPIPQIVLMTLYEEKLTEIRDLLKEIYECEMREVSEQQRTG